VNGPTAVVVGCRWHERQAEPAFAIRSLAGAASRIGSVTVLVPGDSNLREADGAFDLHGLGSWPDGIPADTTVMVDELTPEIAGLLAGAGRASVLFLLEGGGVPEQGWRRLELVAGDDPICVHVPVNRLAERHRHHGFGFTDYLLVLSDRPGGSPGGNAEPPPAAAWLSAAFNDADVVVVENAVASAWKGRALRGNVSVDTRMDLWRLMAHANACVDLAPGGVIARECIESLRFGTPIIVPERSGPAEVHAQASGGSVFGDPDELITSVRRLQSTSHRSAVSVAGRRYADDRYGDPASLVDRLRKVLHGE
jgi:hypothetical protein